MKESKEFILGCILLGKFVAQQAKDGLDWKDGAALASKLVNDEAFRNKLLEAVSGVTAIHGEFKEFSFQEGIELMRAIVESLSQPV